YAGHEPQRSWGRSTAVNAEKETSIRSVRLKNRIDRHVRAIRVLWSHCFHRSRNQREVTHSNDGRDDEVRPNSEKQRTCANYPEAQDDKKDGRKNSELLRSQ